MTSRKRHKPPVKTMADYAMSMEQLELWLYKRGKSKSLPHPTATSLSVMDGHVAAIVAGPRSYDPSVWICPLLGVEPDAFNHDTEEFAAIACVLMRHNTISNTLSAAPEEFTPIFIQTSEGKLDLKPWCMSFYAAIKLQQRDWLRLLSPQTKENSLLRPILFYCVDADGRDVLHQKEKDLMKNLSTQEIAREIPSAVEAIRQFWMPTRFNIKSYLTQ